MSTPTSSLILDADSVANLLASVSDFTQVEVTDGQITAATASGDLKLRLSGLSGSIGVVAGGITLNVQGITIAKNAVKADFTIAKPA